MKKYVLIFTLIAFGYNIKAQWTQTNGPLSGDVSCVVTNGSSIYAGISNTTFKKNHGLYISKNNGISWDLALTGLPASYDLYSIAISGNNIFAGMYEESGNSGHGMVYISKDNGLSWNASLTLQSGGSSVSSLLISGSTIYAGTRYNSSNMLFKSTNDGANWTLSSAGLPQNLWVNSFTYNTTTIFAGTGNGVYISNDGGTNWSATSLTNYVFTLEIKDNNIWAGTKAGLYKSVDNGQNWSLVNSSLPATWIRSLAVKGVNIFAGTDDGGLFLSKDNGLSWSQADSGISKNGITSLAISGNNIYVGTKWRGIFVSDNDGKSWISLGTGTPSNTWVHSLVSNDSNVFAGTKNGAFMTVNNGLSWNGINFGTKYLELLSLVSSGGKIYAGTTEGLFISENNGLSWNPTNMKSIVYSIILKNNNIYIGSNGVYKSEDNGASWALKKFAVINSEQFNGFAANDKYLYSFSSLNDLYVSNDEGETWSTVSTPTTFTSFAFIGTNIYAASGSGIYLSSDNGVSWITVNNGITRPNLVTSITTDGFNLFAGTDGYGVFLSKNGGQSWSSINTGLTVGGLRIFSLLTKNDLLFGGTSYSGVWKLPLCSFLDSPVAAENISGLDTICQGQNSVIYTVPTIANATSYVWNLPNGATGTSTTNSITLNYGTSAVSGNISVKGTSYCNDGVSSSLAITVNPLPVNAGTISGLDIVCQGQNPVNYTVPEITNATSNVWSLPTGVTGTSTTNSITVCYTTSATSGEISVKGTNSCGDGTKSTLAITVAQLPDTAGTISGLATVCPEQNSITYSVPSINNATSYGWTLPIGATGISTTNSITVSYSSDAVSGNITVKGINSCGDGPSSSLAITVNPLPSNASAITGTATTCQGQNSVTYNIPSITNANSYIWSLPNGSSGTSATNNISVNYGASAVSGNVSVKGHNTCGDGTSSSLAITVNPSPSKPTISLVGDTLLSDASSGNQWYNQNGIINGANNQNYVVTTNNTYYVVVSNAGCSSDSSNNIHISNVGIDEVAFKSMKIYPNPVSNELIIELEDNKDNFGFEILNQIGQVVYKGNMREKVILKTTNFPAGVYLIKLENGKTFKFKKIIKE